MDYVEPQYHQILFRLADKGVDFIGVGMVSASLQGVPLTTLDLDIVHRTLSPGGNAVTQTFAYNNVCDLPVEWLLDRCPLIVVR